MLLCTNKKCSKEVEDSNKKQCKSCRDKQALYASRYRAKRRKENPSLCCYDGCVSPREDSFLRCRKHLDYANDKKLEYRALKDIDLCYGADCKNRPTPGYKSCRKCRERKLELQRNDPQYNDKCKIRRDRVKSEVFDHYNNYCLCCGETQEEFLTLDHIGGRGPRPKADRGSALHYRLKKEGFPPGYRTLCLNCNFSLGHFGYCPHGDLAQVTKVGRPPALEGKEAEIRRKARREVNQRNRRKLKLTTFDKYGGCVCSCCGEPNHECLSLDHIEGNGPEHGKEMTGDKQNRSNLYNWLKKDGYPPGYRVLCMNCNFALGHWGYCHKEKE